MPYSIMAKGYPWVMPSLLCKKWFYPNTSRTTRVAQCLYQLKVNCTPLGHSNQMAHSTSV